MQVPEYRLSNSSLFSEYLEYFVGLIVIWLQIYTQIVRTLEKNFFDRLSLNQYMLLNVECRLKTVIWLHRSICKFPIQNGLRYDGLHVFYIHLLNFQSLEKNTF